MDAIEVLVVEDEPVIYELLEDALSEAGFKVSYAPNAEAAIDAIEAADMDYAALVTDIALVRGGATGWDVARRARELRASLPVVYMTGDSAGDWASNGVPNSVLITKPFAPMQVVTALSHLLNTTSGQGE
jgi:DNA-binding response OmpR family regulator